MKKPFLLTLCLLALAQLAGAQNVSNDLDPILSSLEPRALGPTTMGGRIMEIAVYEKEPRIFYVGAASGGLWKTENAGVSFRPIFDKQSSVALGAVGVCQEDPDLLYVGTGEESSRNSTSWGDGVYKSTDGGGTWTHLGLSQSGHIGQVIVHPKDKETVYVAAVGNLWGRNPERGVFKTTDGGKTWTRVLFVNDLTGAVDLVMDPRDPDVLIAAMWHRERSPYDFQSRGPGSGLFKTTDGGKNWRRVTRGVPDGPVGRIGLSMYRKNPDVIVATIDAPQGGTFRSRDLGDSWERINGLNPRPFYFSTPKIDPNDENRIYVLGVQFHFSEDAGRTFRTMAMDIHVDHHALWIDPRDSNHLILGNDGGVAQSRDRGRTWEHFDNIPLGQFYAIGYDMRKPYWVYGGLQDNGSWAGPTQTRHDGVRADDWIGVGGGDGFYVVVDPDDWTTVYSESQGGALSRINQLTGESRFIRPRAPQGQPPYRFNWNSPVMLSPHNSRTLYFGGNVLFRSVNRGDDWEVISPDLTTNDPAKQVPPVGDIESGAERHCTITTVTESPLRYGLLWVGTDDGRVHVTRDGGETWKDVTGNIPGVPVGTWVSRVHASNHAEGRCYVTLDGHRENDYKPYVYMTDDFGETWTDIGSGLPVNNSAYVVRDGQRNADFLVLGTEVGLWMSLNRGATWTKYTTGSWPTVRVDDVKIHPRDLDLLIGTHGRSVWIVPVSAMEEMTAANREKNVHLCAPTTMYLLGRVTGLDWQGDRRWGSPNTQPAAKIFYHLKEKTDARVTVRIEDAAGNEVQTIQGTGNAGLNSVTFRPVRRGQVRDGDYTVRLRVGEDEYRTALRVEDLAKPAEQNGLWP